MEERAVIFQIPSWMEIAGKAALEQVGCMNLAAASFSMIPLVCLEQTANQRALL